MATFLDDDLPTDEWQKRRGLQVGSGDPNGGIDPAAPTWVLNDGMPSAEWQRVRAQRAVGAKPVAAPATYSKRDAARDLGAGTLLDQIGIGEQKGRTPSYDVTYGFGAFVPEGSKKLTDMTFREVAALQKEMLRRQAGADLRSSAVGKYQFLQGEAERLRVKLGLKETDRFTAGVQDGFRDAGGSDPHQDTLESGWRSSLLASPEGPRRVVQPLHCLRPDVAGAEL